MTSTENNEDSEETTPTTPRQSGSMVTHQDDVVTRMKNIEMIELGRHRIKPWYFAPYPQVSLFLSLADLQLVDRVRFGFMSESRM